MNRSSRWGLAALLLAGAAGVLRAQETGPAPPLATPPAAVVDQAAADRFKAAGREAAITVAPTRMAGRSFPQVGEVIAVMLERSGMTDLETSEEAFAPPPGADLAATAAALGEFIRDHPATTEYLLFTEFALTRREGIAEVRAIVVGAQGEVVWMDRQVRGDADFERIKPEEPMDCCVLVVDRLRPVLALDEMRDEGDRIGKIEACWRARTGVPDRAERAAIEERGAAFRKAAADATLMVFPAHAGDAFSTESAASIASMINERKLARATAADAGPRFEIPGDSNEQKVLWAMARAFSDYIRMNPPGTDYAMFTDYLMGPGVVGGVHFAICNRQGELVVVDFQNSHWPDFQSVNPRSREDCDRLVLKRLEGYCR
ncbi:MAG: hypothetical protein IT436_09555 [Phycisphaerales bacterium]|nr:hypothetical protein [Phycisphaerales bacterium]